MTELEALKARHSVRNYQDKEIDKETIDKLCAFIDECNSEGNLKLQFLEDSEDTYSSFLNKFMSLGSAPSVIACVGEKADDLHERIGYYGQKIVLYAQQLGLNTCWAGTFSKSGIPCICEKGDEVVITIAIGYGKDSGKERKSKKASDVCEVPGNYEDAPDWFKAGVEAALLAPTAINQQKFKIFLKDNGEVSFIDKGGVFSKVDLGIVKYQFEVGSKSVKRSI